MECENRGCSKWISIEPERNTRGRLDNISVKHPLLQRLPHDRRTTTAFRQSAIAAGGSTIFAVELLRRVPYLLPSQKIRFSFINETAMHKRIVHLEPGPFRSRMHEIIFEADTREGKLFDVMLIIFILFSVTTVMLDSIASVHMRIGGALYIIEWFFTILFTIEYLLRLLSVSRPLSYATSFFGVIDLLAILPTYFSTFLPGLHFLLVIRILRILRIFRVFKLVKYLQEAQLLLHALRASQRKIAVFMFMVLTLVVALGSAMYVVESPESGFTSIPRSIYWAIVTLTTVGYGDISPHSTLGQILASVVMLIGYAIIAVPTGIITAEIAIAARKEVTTQACPHCSKEGHDPDAKYCKNCGTRL